MLLLLKLSFFSLEHTRSQILAILGKKKKLLASQAPLRPFPVISGPIRKFIDRDHFQ